MKNPFDDHYPTMFDDYGGPIIECAAKKCGAGAYDWWAYHREIIVDYLYDWLKHSKSCEINQPFGELCTCGLDKALEGIK